MSQIVSECPQCEEEMIVIDIDSDGAAVLQDCTCKLTAREERALIEDAMQRDDDRARAAAGRD